MINANIEENGHFALEEIQGIPDEPIFHEMVPYKNVENVEIEEFNVVREELDLEQNIVMETAELNVDDQDFEPDLEEIESSDLEDHSADNQVFEVDDDLEEQNLADNNPKRKRSTKYEVNKKNWCENINRLNREKGKSYLGKKKDNGKWNYNLLKEPRSLKVSCNCKLSKNEKSMLQCRRLQEDERKVIFKQFWEYTWTQKKMFVNNHVCVNQTVRKRGENENSRRTYSNKFYLGKGRLRVCKAMFFNTLGVKEWVIKKWAKGDLENNEQVGLPDPESDQIRNTRIKLLHNFFDSIPKLESHYCRASTSKLYLEPIWNSKAHLYNVYKSDFCKNQNERPVSIATFHKEFDKKRLSLYRPKKDLCDTCVAFETKNLIEEKYNEHIKLKEEARNEKLKDKESHNEVFTMDLQSVLLCPKSNVSSLYL